MIIRTYIKVVDTINEWVGRTVMWLFLALTASVLIDMFYRYLTGRSTDWAFDINYMIYAANFMLAGGFCMLHEKHVRVDAFYIMMPLRWRGILEIIFFPGSALPHDHFLSEIHLDQFHTGRGVQRDLHCEPVASAGLPFQVHHAACVFPSPDPGDCPIHPLCLPGCEGGAL